MKTLVADIDSYILQSLPMQQRQLQRIREIIRNVAPLAQECISYGMPAFKQHGVLVYFAANKHHIGFYPTSQPIIEFAEQLKPYVTSKGAVQFPWGMDLPEHLIVDIVKYRMVQDEEQYTLKKQRKK